MRYRNNNDMSNEIKDFLSRLRSPLMVAEEEGISVQAVYKRIRLNKCEYVDICGTKFVIKNE